MMGDVPQHAPDAMEKRPRLDPNEVEMVDTPSAPVDGLDETNMLPVEERYHKRHDDSNDEIVLSIYPIVKKLEKKKTLIKMWELVRTGYVDPYHLWDHDMLYFEVYVALQELQLIPNQYIQFSMTTSYPKMEGWLFNVIKYINPKLFCYVLKTRGFIMSKLFHQAHKTGFRNMRWEDQHLVLNFSEMPPSPADLRSYSQEELRWKGIRCDADGLQVAIRDVFENDRNRIQALPKYVHETVIKDALGEGQWVSALLHNEFMEAVRYGHPINYIFNNEETYLSRNIDQLQLDQIQQLIDAGANVNLGKSPPLYQVAVLGEPDKIEVLMNGGADVNLMIEDWELTILASLIWDVLHEEKDYQSLQGLNLLLQYDGIDFELAWHTLSRHPNMVERAEELQHLSDPARLRGLMAYAYSEMTHLTNVTRPHSRILWKDFPILDAILDGEDVVEAWIEHQLQSTDEKKDVSHQTFCIVESGSL
eukprot:TRINITY_DN2414_c0_g1_i10.p1 TRINITY_DN2414_c0_g1~~TRINITY_DN2414_c0_g1_i10.p1  ORF type:complete len:521 (-),score=119.75 TRINITY_DN2414_c0_g1_i10:362-1789(-)